MEVKTLIDLIDWSRQLHAMLADCLSAAASSQQDERTRMLLGYMADHESKMALMVAAFEAQADPKASQTYLYDYLPHKLPIKLLEECRTLSPEAAFEHICQQVFTIHEDMIELYRGLLDNAVIPEAESLLSSLQSMEEYEGRRLVQQMGRMQDL